MKSKTILSADEMLEILNSQWATVMVADGNPSSMELRL